MKKNGEFLSIDKATIFRHLVRYVILNLRLYIYIGNKTEKSIEDKLHQICIKKEISCYKMVLNYTGKDFKLTPVLYDDYINSK